jgi:hypothetical protein
MAHFLAATDTSEEETIRPKSAGTRQLVFSPLQAFGQHE